MAETQTYATHRQYVPLFHFFAVPLLALNVIVRLIYAFRHAGARLVWWEVIVALALAALALTVRGMATRVQDRVIRLEETLRLERCLPAELRVRTGELSPGQLIGLRFCSDEETTELTRAALNEKLGREEIKKRVKNWRPDHLRV